MPGVTRDRVSTFWEISGKFVELVDTGGYGFVDPDQLTDHIKNQIELAMTRADLVLFIVDCSEGVTGADDEIAAMLRKRGIKPLLVANKCDGERVDTVLADFATMGLGTPIGVSAMNGRNLELVVRGIQSKVDMKNAPDEMPNPQMYFAIVGKRNAGKSTLVNAIDELYQGQGDRVIVSEVPGTTRDSIDVRFEKEGKTLVVIDTAGVRKKRHMMTNDIEFYSFHRAQRSVRRSDVVMMLLDSTEPVSEPDKKLGQYIAEQFKPVLIVVNKWDLAKAVFRKKAKMGETDELDESGLMDKYQEYVGKEMPYLAYAPILFLTAKDGKNVQVALDTAQHLFNQSRQRMTTGRLNRAIRQILVEKQPSTKLGKRAKVFYCTQIDVQPPTLALVVNNPDYFDEGYRRHIVNRLRDLLPYPEVPIRLLVNGRTQRLTTKEKHQVSIEELDEDQMEQSGPADENIPGDDGDSTEES